MIDIIQKQLLEVLYEQETVNIYAWHQITCLSPISIASAVLSLRKSGIMQLSDNHENAYLTEYGRKWIEQNSKELFANKREEPWKNVPAEMVSADDTFFQSFYEVPDLQRLLDNINE